MTLNASTLYNGSVIRFSIHGTVARWACWRCWGSDEFFVVSALRELLRHLRVAFDAGYWLVYVKRHDFWIRGPGDLRVCGLFSASPYYTAASATDNR